MPGVRGASVSFFRAGVLSTRRTRSLNPGPGEPRYKPFPPPNRNGRASHENVSIETYFVRRDLSSSGWADRSAEDRRLRKAEAVGSNPTRSILPGFRIFFPVLCRYGLPSVCPDTLA